MLSAITPFQERYGFLRVPTKLEDFDEGKGIKLEHGKFTVTRQGTPTDIVIDSFVVYTNGIVADTRSFTDEADAFLDDAIQFAMESFKLTLPEKQRIEKVYLSNLEVVLNKPTDAYFGPAAMLSNEIQKCLESYALKSIPYTLTGTTFFMDKTKIHNTVLTPFSIDRREGLSFDENIYFSSAPLKTQDHVTILEKLDSIKL
jgi:hypothetical protein